MHIFFGDDSIRTGKRVGMGQILGFGGLILEESALRPLQIAIKEIKEQFGIPSTEEIKWSPSRKSWIWNNLKAEDRTNCYRAILDAAHSSGAKAIVVCQDLGRLSLTPESALPQGIRWCFERITMYLADKNSLGLIVCDRPGGGQKEDDGILSTTLETIQAGTEFVLPTQVHLNILTTKSHLLIELQIADLVVGITTAMVAGDVHYAAPLFNSIRPMLHENSLGYRGGTGLKLHPKSLNNLYHWILNENEYVKAAQMTGIPLPNSRWPYYTE